jgi:hypothetical protein
MPFKELKSINPMAFPILSRIPLGCHSREGGSPERFEKTGFLLSQERRIEIENDFFRKQPNDIYSNLK